jgi:cytochrome b561
MGLKSTSDRYGTVALLLHWTSAVLIVGLMVAGFRAASMIDPMAKANILRMHAPVGVAVLLLTLFRIGWWTFADRKPGDVEGMPRLQSMAAKAVHGLFYVAIVGLAASGIGLMAISGAGDVLFGGAPGPLPDFWAFAPRYGHAAMARLMLALLVLHVGAAFYHQFVRRDRVFARMGIGR